MVPLIMPDGSDKTEQLQISIHGSIEDIGKEAWDYCAGPDNPFISYDFLHALEETDCVSADTGWMPQHIKLTDSMGNICGVAPLYVKNHSHGEYVFDWGWADAYERAGGQYYPKLLSAVPFTPVSGKRLLVPDGPDAIKYKQALASGMIQLADKYKIVSIHINFLPEEDAVILQEIGYLLRNDMQFHWKNEEYESFAHFLQQLTSRKRRSIRKERKKLLEAGLTFKRLAAEEITEEAWDDFYRFYTDTYDRKWGAPYLNREFFDQIHHEMKDKILLVMAYDQDDKAIAGAINLIGTSRLFGRNWGCEERYKFLHFEVCYYQAIEFAIENKISHVEAGTQGQHKLQRGYMPVKTYSAHWIADPGFKPAIENFLKHERAQVYENIEILSEQGPYRIDEEA